MSVRLTYKLEEPIKTTYYDIKRGNYGRITDAMIYNELGRFEDFMEEVGLDTVEELRKCYSDNFVYTQALITEIQTLKERWQKLKEYINIFKEYNIEEANLAWKITDKMKELEQGEIK